MIAHRNDTTLAEIEAALALMTRPGQTIEIRHHSGGGMTAKHFKSIGAAAKYAAAITATAKGVYVPLNPFNFPLGTNGEGKPRKAAGDEDVTRRALLLIDCDPVRTVPESSATDDEKAASLAKAEAIRAYLRGEEWPDPILVDSGNGTHLLYRIDLPNDEDSKVLIRGVLSALAAEFDDADVVVDQKVFNASRITKLPGTIAGKGPNTPDRPHRWAALLETPDDHVAVPADKLRAIAALAPKDFDLEATINAARDRAALATQSKGRRTDNLPRRVEAYLAKCAPAISGQKGHDAAFKAACKIGPGFDLSPAETLDWLRVVYNPTCDPPWSDRELEHKVAEAYKVEKRRGWLLNAERPGRQDRPRTRSNGNDAGEPPKPARGEDGRQPRPDIEITTERHIALDKTIAALAADPDIYWRGESLVTIVDESESQANLRGGITLRNAKGSPRIVTLGESSIGCHLTRFMTFFSWRTDRSGEEQAVEVHPPVWLVRGLVEKKYWPGIRELKGIADIPYIRADGSIFSIAGYDPQTGTLLRPTVVLDRPIGRPTQADARAAAERLFVLVKQFPFATVEDRAVWLAALLNAAARPAIDGPTPGVAVNGNKAGCGKGLLIDAIARIVWGWDVPTTTYPVDPIEAQKVKVAIALSAKPAVNFDNIEEGQSYGNPAIDSAITSTEIDDRMLGTAKNTGRLALRPCWFVNGNNTSPGKDAHRRWLVCNLTTDLERPEERGDIEIPDLRSHISTNRAELVRDVLTILKAHADAGYPNSGRPPLGSFEAWDRIVRGAVWFATSLDCCDTRKKAADEAPERMEKLALLEAWREIPGGGDNAGGLTVEKALQAAMQDTEGALYQAFMKRSRDGKTPDIRRVGNFIRGIKGSVTGGLKFEKAGEERRSVKWRVAGTPTEKPCECGESGESRSYPPRVGLHSHSDVMVCGESGKAIWNGPPQHSSDSSDSHLTYETDPDAPPDL